MVSGWGEFRWFHPPVARSFCEKYGKLYAYNFFKGSTSPRELSGDLFMTGVNENL